MEKAFDAADTNGDGELDGAEVAAAFEAQEGPPPKDIEWPSEEEVAAWVESELAKDGSISKEEAAAAIQHWAESQGVRIPKEVWDMLDQAFDMADTNGDGELDGAEIAAAWGQEKVQLKTKAKKVAKKIMLKLKQPDFPELTEEQEQEIEDWVEDQLADGGTITKDEAAEAIQDFADTHGFTITDEMWEFMEMVFDMVDTNDDGEIDGGEL